MPVLRRVSVFLASASIVLAIPASVSATTADESLFLAKINAHRASSGASQLGLNLQLEDMARAWAAQMASKGSISHNPNLSKQAPGNWQKIGENVGMGYSVDGLHQAFINSPGHNANLVDKDFNQAGVGVIESGGKKFVVEVFMKSPTPATVVPKAPAAKPLVANTTSPAPLQPKPIDNLSPKLRSYRSGIAVQR